METPAIAESQRRALESLLDDPSPVVRQALLRQFAHHGGDSLNFLQGLARHPNRQLAGHASWYLRELKFADPVSEFRDFIHSLNYELESGALLLSRTVNTGLDVGACCTRLDALATRCRELVAAPAATRDKCHVLNQVLFREDGLRGNSADYTDPRNSYIDQVLARRKGIPISLSIIYLLVAERLGLHLEPVGLPGHFMVGCYDEALPFFVDPYNGGAILSAAEVLVLLKATNGTASVVDLAPTPVREVLCRCCRNLVNHYTATEHPEEASLFAGFVAEFESVYERHASP